MSRIMHILLLLPGLHLLPPFPLANPSILDISRGNCAELVLRVTPIAYARCYEVWSAAVDAVNAPGQWQTAGVSPAASSFQQASGQICLMLAGLHALLS
jgi:hypothetical protein